MPKRKKKISDIFSKEKEKVKACPNPKVPVIIDTREKQSLVGASLIEESANIEFEKLDVGDYLVGDVIIERKAFSDFVSSIVNKRLISQLTDMKEYKKSILIVEGFYYDYESSFVHENAVRGMILSALLDFDVKVVFTEDEEDTAKFLLVLAKRQEKGFVKSSMRLKKSSMSFEEQKKFILEGFPGIGPVTSEKLLEHYRTLENVFFASREEIREIGNLDEKKAESFRKILEE